MAQDDVPWIAIDDSLPRVTTFGLGGYSSQFSPEIEVKTFDGEVVTAIMETDDDFHNIFWRSGENEKPIVGAMHWRYVYHDAIPIENEAGSEENS